MVNHDLLLTKLKIYRFSNITIEWFSSYLYDRTQVVKIGNTISSKRNVEYGVPQGSILGPLLFLLYVNDLPLYIDSSYLDMYADDSTLHTSANSFNDLQVNLQNNVYNIENWCNENGMRLNPKKCKSMVIGSRQKLANIDDNLNILISNEIVENVQTEKLLGIVIDENLNWKEQINQMCVTISRRIHLLQKIKNICLLI